MPAGVKSRRYGCLSLRLRIVHAGKSKQKSSDLPIAAFDSFDSFEFNPGSIFLVLQNAVVGKYLNYLVPEIGATVPNLQTREAKRHATIVMLLVGAQPVNNCSVLGNARFQRADTCTCSVEIRSNFNQRLGVRDLRARSFH